MGNHKVILQYSDRDYGTVEDSYYSVKLPSNLKGECYLYVDEFILDNKLCSFDTDYKTFNVELPQLTNIDTYNTATKSCSSIVWTGKKDTFDWRDQTEETSLNRIRIPNNFLQQNQINVKLTSPHIDFKQYTQSVEYPPVALTGNTTSLSNQPYGNGVYITSFSSADTTSSAFQAFNKLYNGNIPRTSFNLTNTYNGSTGFYDGTASNSTVMSGSNYFGEHLTIQLPTSIVLESYLYTSHGEYGNRCGNMWVLGGSVDGTNWTLLNTQSNVFWTDSNETKTFSISNNTQSFNYYRMLTTRVGNSNVSSFRNDWGLAELRLLGQANVKLFNDYILSLSIKDADE